MSTIRKSRLKREPLPRSTPPRKPKNADVRERGEFLKPDEVERLCRAAGSVGRHRERDYAMIFFAYRHALRVSELTELKWDKITLKYPGSETVWVDRKKGSVPNSHPLAKDEVKLLKKLAPKDEHRTGYVFGNERGGKLTESAVRKLVARAGKLAEFPWHVHPHQLRHACGHTMANKKIPTGIIQHWLGHVNSASTARYAVIDAETLRGIWD
jgi:integrase